MLPYRPGARSVRWREREIRPPLLDLHLKMHLSISHRHRLRLCQSSTCRQPGKSRRSRPRPPTFSPLTHVGRGVAWHGQKASRSGSGSESERGVSLNSFLLLCQLSSARCSAAIRKSGYPQMFHRGAQFGRTVQLGVKSVSCLPKTLLNSSERTDFLS